MKLYLVKSGVDTNNMYDVVIAEVIAAESYKQAREMTSVCGPIMCASIELIGEGNQKKPKVIMSNYKAG